MVASRFVNLPVSNGCLLSMIDEETVGHKKLTSWGVTDRQANKRTWNISTEDTQGMLLL